MTAYLKDFDTWNVKKKRVNSRNEDSVFVQPREVWWTAVGVNVGTEIDGKHGNFERPVLIFRKLGRKQFLGVPLTSRPNRGPLFVRVSYGDEYGFACLSQLKTFSHKRLLRKMGVMKQRDYKTVVEKMVSLCRGERV